MLLILIITFKYILVYGRAIQTQSVLFLEWISFIIIILSSSISNTSSIHLSIKKELALKTFELISDRFIYNRSNTEVVPIAKYQLN